MRAVYQVNALRSSHVARSAYRRIKASDVKRAIDHAKLVCFNFESTPACRVAWDRVEEISSAFDAQESRPRPPPECSELSKRDYDI